MSDQTTFVFCGGGSGGHLYPGVAVADDLRRRDARCRIVFVGSLRDVERSVLEETGYDHVRQDVLSSSQAFRNPVAFFLQHRRAVKKAISLLQESRPHAVIGLGGFASVPVVTAARKLGIPIILLEQNCVAGRATRWLSRKAAAVCISFPETWVGSGKPEVVLTGNPVRASVCAAGQTQPGNRILILGGSQGATRLNDVVCEVLSGAESVPDGWSVLHQTGTDDCDRVRRHYDKAGIDATVQPFLSEMSTALADSGLVISRAGGTTIAELAVVGRATILVPYPASVSDHQKHNANCLAEAHAAEIVEHGPAAGRLLQECVARLLDDDEQRDRFARAIKLLGSPGAASDVADVVLKHARL